MVLLFLRWLTLYKRNVQEIVELDGAIQETETSGTAGGDVASKYDRKEEGSSCVCVTSSVTEVVGKVLRVLFNLSFEGKCRERLIKLDCQSCSVPNERLMKSEMA